jgi:small-conductance mechanosensitive channel
MDILTQQILGNTLQQWLIAVTLTVAIVLLLRLIQRLAARRLAALASLTETQWDDIVVGLIGRTKLLFLFIVGLFFGSLLLELPAHIRSLLSSLLIISLLVQAGIWGVSFITSLLEAYRQRALKKNPAAITSINVIGLITKFILWSSILLLALNNLGINVTSLIAGLGIGGVAVALAIQNILGDLFASLSIVLDKPFVIGDFLMIGDFMGSVEYIGLKTTRIRSLSGEQLVFSNSDLLGSRIRNYGRMFERRVVFSIGVTYQTPRERLKLIPEIIREAIESKSKTRFDRCHFMKYGDYALIFETVFYVLSPDYNAYMDIQQAIYFEIHERFEQEQIEFAYPTQKLFVTQPDA